MPAPHDLRELLFGDLPAQTWAWSGTGEPWDSFRHAVDLIDAGNPATARQQLYNILGFPQWESRHYLQTWDALRALGEVPQAAAANHLYGIVLDVPMEEGGDTLAAYSDYSCRYLNFSGTVTIWDHPNDALNPFIDRLFEAGRALVAHVGVWDGPRPPLPPGMARISLLCPNGLHICQAPMSVLFEDPKAVPLIEAGTALLQVVVDQAQA